MAFSADYYQASTDEILERLKASFDDASEVIETTLIVRWPGVEEPDEPPSDDYWVRVSLQDVRTVNVAFNNSLRRRTHYGLVFVQVFCPRSIIGSADKGRALADLILTNAFNARPVGKEVIFRNPRVLNLIPEEKFYRFNLVAETEYDDLY